MNTFDMLELNYILNSNKNNDTVQLSFKSVFDYETAGCILEKLNFDYIFK